MTPADVDGTTLLLSQAAHGDAAARAELIPRIYGRLRELAAGQLRRERPGHTLEPTALVHEAYLRLVNQSKVDWKDRSHFLGLAAREMRRVLVDHARGRNRVKRGGGWARIHLEDAPLAVGGREVDFVEIHEAIEKLSAANERQGRIVELRFFSGLTVEEVSEVLGLSARAVEKEWRLARAWLYRLLHEERSP